MQKLKQNQTIKLIIYKVAFDYNQVSSTPMELNVDAGADIVFGHGPHVTRAIDIYKGKFIAYSMGDFATYGRLNLKGNVE